MNTEPELSNTELPSGPPPLTQQHAVNALDDTAPLTAVHQHATAHPPQTRMSDDLVRCPSCGSSQFFGSKKVTGLGWTLYIIAIANIFVSGLLMFVFIGFLTIFLSPILAMIGFYGCRKHVNTCAKCKRDF